MQKLSKAVEIVADKLDWGCDVDELLKEVLIQRFEYTHELAWDVMRDYAIYQGYTDVKGSRDAFRKAFEMGLISDKHWMDSITDKNNTSHNYDDEKAEEIYEEIVNVYFPLFVDFERKMSELDNREPLLF